MDGLNMGLIKRLPVLRAPLSLQKEFLKLARKRSEMLTRLANQAEGTDDLFASLQQRAFKGEL